ncbi:MAG: patatin-like protein [Acidimicrobiia bacterium]
MTATGDTSRDRSKTARELRIAPVMTGGTSLAVWMGGVTAELYDLLCTEPAWSAADESEASVYARLLALTDTRPLVDVITGTSAGGLNGTLLAAALRLGITPAAFMRLRDTWMTVADLDNLMRSPQEPSPASLLKGDDYFMPNVLALIEGWKRSPGRGEGETDLDVVTTVTTLLAEPKHRVDDFDEPISEVSHAQHLRFVKEHFAADGWEQKLALASRTSASIPGVFEPSYLPIGDDDAKGSKRPNFADNASFSSSRWAVDGGVVVNLPLTEALERIFDRRSDIEVRRAVLYVSPTPPAPSAPARQDFGTSPSIREAVSSIVTAPRAEGVASDIDQIRGRNADFERQAAARRHLGPIVALTLSSEPDDEIASASVWAAYRKRRATDSVAQTIGEIRRALRQEASDLEETLRASLYAQRLALFPADPYGIQALEARWAWGIRPVEQAISIGLRLVARAQRLLVEPPTTLTTAKTALFDALETVNTIREEDRCYWQGRYRTLSGQLAGAAKSDWATKLSTWSSKAYQEWLDGNGAQSFGKLFEAHREVAEQLLAARAALIEAASPSGDDGAALTNPRAELESELRVLDLHRGTRITRDQLQQRLLALHVAQTVVLGDVIDREQPVELMQISSNSKNLLDPERSAADKLAGPELARLGAFLKPSWRANDWMWGRMDGAYRLVVLLADPQRIRQLHSTEERARDAVTKACNGHLPRDVGEEIKRLFAGGGDRMRSMPALAAHLAEQVQTKIACEELPNVADAIERSRGNESETRAFRRAYDAALDKGGLPLDRAKDLVRQMHIGTETVRTELGFGTLNRLTTRGASVVVNALTGTHSGVPVLPRVLRPLRAPLHAVASLVSVMVGDSPLSRAVAAFVLAVAGAIVSLELVGIDVPTGTFAISAILLTGLVVVAMLRSGFVWLGACVLAGAAVVGLTLVGSDLRPVVYTIVGETTTPIESGSFVDFGDGVILQITSGERVQTIEIPEPGTVEFRTGGTIKRPSLEHPDGWKRWGFENPEGVTVFQVVVWGLAAAIAVRGVRLLRAAGWFGLLWRWAVAAGMAVVAAISKPYFEKVFEGKKGDNELKDRVMSVAEALEGYSLEVVLLVIVGIAVVLALGTDLVFSRTARRMARAARSTWREGTRRVRELVGARTN